MESDCRIKHGDLCKTIEKKIELQLGIVNTRIDAIREALVIQTTELDRRLDILNGHQQELKNDRDQFLRQDRYDDQMKVLNEWVERAKTELDRLTVNYEKRVNRAELISIIAVLVVIVSTILKYLKN